MKETNGLMRQFLPKNMRFENITDEDISAVIDKVNHRPRKCLGFTTLLEASMHPYQSHGYLLAPRS